MKDLWIWRWKQDGYNSCYAFNREEALEKARKMGGGTVLEVDENTLHVGTHKELNELDWRYGSLCR